MKKPRFTENAFYHIYNRGVEKRQIFLEKNDYFRFIHDLYEFNDTQPAQNLFYKIPSFHSYEVEPRKREVLVEILAFCLMPNHFHLMVRQLQENGIIEFMQKLGTGYTMFFNKKYQRVGPLFQGRFRAAAVTQESHLLHLPMYMHLNPLDTIVPSWRTNKIINQQQAEKFLESYRWSSHLDYMGKKNFPSIISRKFFDAYFKDSQGYKNYFKKWIRDRSFNELGGITLE